MRKFKILFVMLLMAGVLHAQDAAPKVETKNPNSSIAEIDKLRIQLAFANRQLLVSKFSEAKAKFEEDSKKMDADYMKLGSEIQILVEAAYSAAGVDKKEYNFDLAKGEFVKTEAKDSK